MAHVTLLQDIPVTLSPDLILPRLHLKPGSPAANEFRELAYEAQAIASPKAAFQLSFIEHVDEETVAVDGVRFESRVLRANLDSTHRVFAYVATCGMELHIWSEGLDDVLYQFWAEELKIEALRAATQAVYAAIEGLNPGKMASMNPGSLPDWPLQEQRPFFRLLADAPGAIGISLSESCLMTPNKSVSGFRFSNENAYVNCRLCPRESCPGRSAAYDAALFAEMTSPKH